MMDAIPCFPGTNLACLITTLFCILDIRSTLFFLSLNSLHTSCILIGLKHPYEKCAYPYPEITVEKSSCGPEISINVPCPFSQYTGWTNIFYALFFIDLSTMAPPVLPRDLSTVVVNDVFKLSMRNLSGGCYFKNVSLLLLGRKIMVPN